MLVFSLLTHFIILLMLLVATNHLQAASCERVSLIRRQLANTSTILTAHDRLLLLLLGEILVIIALLLRSLFLSPTISFIAAQGVKQAAAFGIGKILTLCGTCTARRQTHASSYMSLRNRRSTVNLLLNVRI